MRTKALLLPLALSLGLAAAALAADSTGTVLSVDDQSIRLILDDGTEVTHPLAAGVTIRTEGGEPISTSDLAQKRVNVDLDAEQRATSIEVVMGDASAAAAARGDLPADTEANQGTLTRGELPDTASPVLLTALIGGVALVAAGATRVLRRR